jgi:hypothetical protein
VNYDFTTRYEALARDGHADALIFASEDGFTPLGLGKRFFCPDLGVPARELSEVAAQNCAQREQITLIAIAPRRQGGLLRGVVLCPGEGSASYARFATPRYGRPYRDFYYNVTYEAIKYACTRWRARNIAISHLSQSGRFHEDIATCNSEALAHFCDENPANAPESFAFVGCCMTVAHLAGIQRLNAEGSKTRHHAIRVDTESGDQYDFLHLSWG